MARISGRNAVVYIGESTPTTVTYATEFSIDVERNVIDSDPTFDESWGDSYGGVRRYNFSMSGLYDDSSDAVYSAITGADTLKFYCYPAKGSTSKYWYGTISSNGFTVTTPAAGNVTITGSGRGTGELGKN